MSIAAVIAGLAALAILIIPFVGVYTSAVLGPLSIVLGSIAYRKGAQGDPLRRTALAGVVIGVIALVVLIVFLATGAYSEYAR